MGSVGKQGLPNMVVICKRSGRSFWGHKGPVGGIVFWVGFEATGDIS
jgi:hypothetical protein